MNDMSVGINNKSGHVSWTTNPPVSTKVAKSCMTKKNAKDRINFSNTLPSVSASLPRSSRSPQDFSFW